jgi:dihydrolipoamide dehydrogenase
MSKKSSTSPGVLVIGAGPGGYVAAIRAAQLGLAATVVEKGELGGVCLNVGCIPSKAIITAAALKERIGQADRYGIMVGEPTIDMRKLVEWKASVVNRLTGGIGVLFKNHGIEHVAGTARFTGPGTVLVETAAGPVTFTPKNTIIATGSRPIEIAGFCYDGENVIGSTEALALPEVPKHLVVIGGGYIGLELGIAYRMLGAEVTVVELLDSILPGTDPELSKVVGRNMKKRKIRTLLATNALGWKKTGDGLVVEVEGKKGREEISCDRILLTVGRRPNVEGIGLAEAGIHRDDDGTISIDMHCRTNVDGIYAIGDVAGQPMLAHKASKEGIVAAEVIAGHRSACDWVSVPAVIFTDPEIASVGLTEAQAAEQGIETVVGRFPFAANGRALTLDHADGFTKIVAEKETGTVIGVHIVGPEAAELISEGALAVEMGAGLEDIALTIHPHPTLPETMMEAAEAALGHAIHIYQGK